MRFHVHSLWKPVAAFREAYRERLDEGVRLTMGRPILDPQDVRLLVGTPTRDEAAQCPRLRAVIIPYAGIEPEVREALRDRPEVTVHNLHHNAVSTAELGLSLLLAAAKFLVPEDRVFRTVGWRQAFGRDRGAILDGKTALIVGFGAIGKRLTAYCQALGMRVVATRRNPEAEVIPSGVAMHTPGQLARLLPGADALILTVPLTDETRGLIGAEELALLPEGALLVNIARGPVVDEEALYEALKSGRLLAAGLDVWYDYPPKAAASGEPADDAKREFIRPSRFPFHQLDNVVMSPHRGGGIGLPDVERVRIEQLAGMINRAAEGKPLPNKVNLKERY